VATAQPQVQASVSSASSVQSQPQITPSNGSHASAVPTERGVPIKSNVDPMLKPGTAPKDPCSVTIHLVESSHTTLPNGKPPFLFVYKKSILPSQDLKKIKPLFSSLQKAKSGPFRWNEEFKMYIKDAEMEVVCLRFCSKNDFKVKGKDLVGEIEFPLRGAVRKFDKPNGIFQSFPLKNGTDKVGEALLFIEYCDPRPFSGPSDVQHKGHVGLTSAGGFEIRDIPQEWKQLFRVLNIKKKDLENNAQMAQEVFDIMQKAVSEGVIPGSGDQEANDQEETPSTPAGVSSSDHPVSHHQPQPQQAHAVTTPAFTPAPPPPPVQSSGPKPPPPPTQQPSGPKPPPPPGPTAAKSTTGGGLSLIEQIQRGTNLKQAQVKQVQAGTASTGNPLADTLLSAMSKYRVDIEGKDNDETDDWGD
jgi:hypothetical protein